MLDTASTKAGVQALEAARRLRPMIEAAAPAIEAARQVTPEVMAALHEAKLFRMLLPKSLNGLELDIPAFTRVVEEIARADASTAWCVGQGCGCSFAAAFFHPEAAHAVFDKPDAVLAWGPSNRNAIAVKVEGGYRITGQWVFASGGRYAEWLGAHCTLSNPDGSPVLDGNGQPVERSVLFPKSSAKVTDVWDVMGLRGTGSDNYEVTDLFVPDAYGFTRDLLPERREEALLYRFSFLNIYGAAFAGVALGVSRAMLDSFYALAQKKTPNQGAGTLANSAAIQRETGYNEAKWQAGRAYLYSAWQEAWDEVAARDGECTPEQKVTLRMVSTWAIQSAKEAAEWAYQSAGSTAIFQDKPFERRFRDIHCATQQGQSFLTNYEPAGRMMLGLGAVPRRG
ncbi:MAG: acyl-CoA dehydrogenase family protein [Beijerinckiaceae bacterium]